MTVVKLMGREIDNLSDVSLKEAYNEIANHISDEFDGVSVRSYGGGGRGAEFAAERSIQTFLDSVSLSGAGEEHLIRTIHKAKGAEFDNVLVWFSEGRNGDSEVTLRKVLTKEGEEAQRVYYVGLSRAQKWLFLGIPSLGEELRKILEERDVQIEVL